MFVLVHVTVLLVAVLGLIVAVIFFVSPTFKIALDVSKLIPVTSISVVPPELPPDVFPPVPPDVFPPAIFPVFPEPPPFPLSVPTYISTV